MPQLLVLTPISEYHGDRVMRVVRAIKAKNPLLEVTTSREVWLRTRPRKPAYVSHSEWKARQTGFYAVWYAAYRSELAKFKDVLVIPRVDGTVGNGTRMDIKACNGSRVNVLLDDRLVPIDRTDVTRDREDRINTLSFKRLEAVRI